MSYARTIPVEFCHCDPAGIVFYPRYAEMVNHMVENFFLEVVGHGFGPMMAAGQGMPTVALQMTFRKPARLGERLDWTLAVAHLGRSSARFLVRGADRVEAQATVVWMARDFAPSPWPDDIRRVLEAHHA